MPTTPLTAVSQEKPPRPRRPNPAPMKKTGWFARRNSANGDLIHIRFYVRNCSMALELPAEEAAEILDRLRMPHTITRERDVHVPGAIIGPSHSCGELSFFAIGTDFGSKVTANWHVPLPDRAVIELRNALEAALATPKQQAVA